MKRPAGGWTTYAALIFGKLEPTPGSPKTIEEVDALVAMRRAKTRPLKDGRLQVYQFMETPNGF